MKKRITCMLAVLVLFVLSCGLCACSDKKDESYGEVIVNGGFEKEVGALPGWKTEGQAFGKFGVVNTTSVQDIVVGKEGNNFFSGYDAGSPAFVGTMTSTPFVLAGTGKIVYRIGGGQDPAKCYIEFIDYKTNEVLLKKGNDDFQSPYVTAQLVPNVADLSAHIGKTLVIKITDNDKDKYGYSYLNLDGFKVLLSEEEVTAANELRASVLEEIGPPSFSETETDTTIKNGGFEDGLNNWLVLEGDAFNKKSISSTDKTFFEGREYNAVGEKFLDGYNLSEKSTGAIRSTKFTLGGGGYISLLIGGAKNDVSYVAICDASDDSELIKITCDHFLDPEMSLNLMRKFVDASEYIGKVLYVKIVDGDNRDGGFAAITVDDIRVSMTEKETRALVNETYLWAQSLADSQANTAIRNYYNTYDYPFEPNVLRFVTPVASKAVYAGNAVNVENWLTEATASYGDVAASEITVQIDSISLGETEITENFDSVDMSTPGLYTVRYSAHYEALVEPATFTVAVANENDVLNGDFETGNLAGWTVTGDATGASVSQAATFWEGDNNFKDHTGVTVQNTHKDGKYFYATDEGKSVTLTSAMFTLGGHGILSFKLGAAGNKSCYVALCDTDGTELIKVTNEQFNDPLKALSMQRWFINASDYIGEEVCIKIVDTATSGFGFIHVDSVKVGLTYEEASAILASDKTWAQDYRQDVLDSTEDMGGRAKEIIQAQRDYYQNLTVSDPRVLTVVTPVSGQSGVVGNTIDLTAPLSEVVWTKIGAQAGDVTVEVTGVKKGDTPMDDVTATAFVPDTAGTYTVSYTVSDGTTTLPLTYELRIAERTRIINGDFETGDLTGWTVLSGNIDTTGGVSSEVHNDWREKLPYNKSGTYFCKNAGLGEHVAWELKSTTFVLGGNGFISFKMASNNAILKVFKEDGTQIYSYKCHTFNDSGFPHVENGGNWCTMRTHYADLSAYKGESLYITIGNAPTPETGWEFGFFDDIETYYAEGTDLSQNKDTVPLTCLHFEGEPAVAVPTHQEGDTTQMDWIAAANEYVAPTGPSEEGNGEAN